MKKYIIGIIGLFYIMSCEGESPAPFEIDSDNDLPVYEEDTETEQEMDTTIFETIYHIPEGCEDIIHFEDKGLEDRVRRETGLTGDLYYEDLKDILYLDTSVLTIKSLGGLRCMDGLTKFQLAFSEVSNIGELGYLKNLMELTLRDNNRLVSITPLVSLENLNTLNIYSETIVDISSVFYNNGIGEGDNVDIYSGAMDCSSPLIQDQLQGLIDRGVNLNSSCI